ncbi:MAG: hypothetical protein NZ556_00810 [Fimbriimonadales bacterium]|nr:hypothetical protein [Fimbriimonadales bacterium]
MEVLTIQPPAQVVRAPKQKADELNIPIETLLLASILNLLSQPNKEFKRVMEFVLDKNQELYERLFKNASRFS